MYDVYKAQWNLVELRLHTPTFMYRHSQGNPNSSSLQFEVAYWPALAVGGAAQLAAAQCLDLGPTVAVWQTHLCPSHCTPPARHRR